MPSRHRTPWTKEEDQILYDLYKDIGPHRLTDVICRTWRGIEKRAALLGLTKPTPRWSKSECDTALWSDSTPENRSYSATRAKKCNLRKKHKIERNKSIKDKILSIEGYSEMSVNEISQKINAKIGSVRAIITRHNIKVGKSKASRI